MIACSCGQNFCYACGGGSDAGAVYAHMHAGGQPRGGPPEWAHDGYGMDYELDVGVHSSRAT